ncbi:LytTR family DNA-binding domain-containing protein [Sphingobium sp. AP49]|uniref:LytTR family DNA-binding domain-containing protein n=1 Tax=Sphingobium sp. AP49 TaxID=1144307 RepID=UPI00026ECF17|nr:LytTR family DNA-binding domain-containing protein [Sphingobium sp. AP49]WHO37930.1 LytTR family DNA-binding domain-containing protein [Sphingobium sp. AP49]
MKSLRRVLLELWAMLPVAAVVGFLGPFGTYLSGDFFLRAGRWWLLLMGAYILARPTMIAWRAIARATGLPRGSLVFWGMVVSSFPLALIWRLVGRDEIRLLGGYPGLLPFTLLCCLLVMTIAWWAERADAHLLRYYDEHMGPATMFAQGAERTEAPALPDGPASRADGTRLDRRLSSAFTGPVLALESEDHYVRVHGPRGSELILMRLRDAIAEMDDMPGAQIHRSWWVAKAAVADVPGIGKSREVRLTNGMSAPVARDSVDRLRQSGFLPG